MIEHVLLRRFGLGRWLFRDNEPTIGFFSICNQARSIQDIFLKVEKKRSIKDIKLC